MDGNVEDILQSWGDVKNSPLSGAVPTSVVYEPQGSIAPQPTPETRIQYVYPQSAQQPAEKPHWLRLVTIALVVGVPSVFGFLAFVLWLLTAPNRMTGQANEMVAGVAAIGLSKPGNITINYAPQCNQGLFGGQACNFPESPAVPTSQPSSIQGRDASLQVSQPQINIWAAPPSQLTIAQLDEIKAKTSAEVAAQHPQWWQEVQIAYAQKRGN